MKYSRPALLRSKKLARKYSTHGQHVEGHRDEKGGIAHELHSWEVMKAWRLRMMDTWPITFCVDLQTQNICLGISMHACIE